MYNGAYEVPGIKIFRFESSLVYSNVEHFVRKLYKKTVNPRHIKAARAAAKRQAEKGGLNHNAANNHNVISVVEVEASDKQSLSEHEMKVDVVEDGVVATSPLNHTEVTPPDPQPSDGDLEVVPKVIILDCSTMADIDYPGVTGLIKIMREYKDAGVEVLLAACKTGGATAHRGHTQLMTGETCSLVCRDGEMA